MPPLQKGSFEKGDIMLISAKCDLKEEKYATYMKTGDKGLTSCYGQSAHDAERVTAMGPLMKLTWIGYTIGSSWTRMIL